MVEKIKKISEWVKQHCYLIAIFLLLLSALVLIVLICDISFYYIKHFLMSFSQHDIALVVATLILAVLTGILALVAWIQLKGLGEVSKSDFLLRIDERDKSPEILKARTIIRRMYCESYQAGIENASQKAEQAVSKKIREKAEQHEITFSEDFIYLKNFLDFLETIAYFRNKDKIDDKELMELMGGSIKRYFRVFRDLIDYIREQKNGDCYLDLQGYLGVKNLTCNKFSNYYCELIRLVKDEFEK